VIMGAVAIVVGLRMRLLRRTEAARVDATTTERIPPGSVDLRKTRPY
jgi:hypothetical protein